MVTLTLASVTIDVIGLLLGGIIFYLLLTAIGMLDHHLHKRKYYPKGEFVGSHSTD